MDRWRSTGQLGPPPNRIIFYHDGVSEGQFKQVLEQGEYSLSVFSRECADDVVWQPTEGPLPI
ncbi:hypothetical protein K438DRAFT_326330 [Mycena galopus ATCC 62051]|nr:hypothetical protein K438DRAFT_326330 [Mycena galopus ATCC 62051]